MLLIWKQGQLQMEAVTIRKMEALESRMMEAMAHRILEQNSIAHNSTIEKVENLMTSREERLYAMEATSKLWDPLIPEVISDLVELHNAKSADITTTMDKLVQANQELASMRQSQLESQEVLTKMQGELERSQKALASTLDKFDKLQLKSVTALDKLEESQNLLLITKNKLEQTQNVLSRVEEKRDKAEKTLSEVRRVKQEAESKRLWLRKLLDEKVSELALCKEAHEKLEEKKHSCEKELENVKLELQFSLENIHQLKGLANEITRHRSYTSPLRKVRAYRRLLQHLESTGATQSDEIEH